MLTYFFEKPPLINLAAFIQALGMWLAGWTVLVLVISYQGQPGVICMTPMAWLIAIPAGLNYVAYSQGRPGRSPFLAGCILGAVLGLLLGVVFFVIGSQTMPDDPASKGTLSMLQLSLILTGIGTVISALLGGFMALRAAALQRRGNVLTAIKPS